MIKQLLKKLVMITGFLAPTLVMAQATVTIQVGPGGNSTYSPLNAVCTVGDTIKFVWVTGFHPTQSDNGTTIPLQTLDGSGGLNSIYKVVMTSVGVVPYYCTAHGTSGGGGMSGTITVNAAVNNTIPVMVENFVYTAPDTLSKIVGSGWTPIATVSLVNKVPVVATQLSYTNSTANGVGNAAFINNTGQDIGKNFGTVNYRDNAVYASALINVATSGTGDYFLAFFDSLFNASNYRGRVFIKTSGTGFRIGVSKSGATAVAGYNSTDLVFGTTYQIVVKYKFVAGATNDSVKLYINPVLGASEPLVPDGQAVTTETDIPVSATTGLGAIAFRQGGGAASAATLTIDGINVGRSWEAVTKVAVINPTVVLNPIAQTFAENAGSATVTLNITNPNASATSVQVVLKGGSANQGTDFTYAAPQTVTFPANSTTAQTFTIPVIDDAIQENDETIIFVLRNTTNNGIIGVDSIHTITIPANDITTPLLSFVAPVAVTKAEGTSLTFNVAIVSQNSNPTSVNVVLKSTSTATAADYTGFTSGTTVTFPGSSSANQSQLINIVVDNIAENAESIVLVLRNPTNGGLLGTDSILTITIPTNDQPLVTHFINTSANVNENAGNVTVQVMAMGANSNANSTTFDVVLKSNTATEGADFTYAKRTVTIPAFKDSTVSIVIPILDDLVFEGDENFVLAIRNINNSGTISTDSNYTVTIKDNEVPLLNISTLRVNDTLGNPTYPLNTPFQIRGVVYTPNMRAAGLQFSLIDPTAAMTIFKASGNLGYTVTEGDSLAVYGKLSPFNGLNEVAIDSFKILATGIALKPAKVVTQLGESDESALVKVLNVHLVDPSRWVPAGSGFNVKVTTGSVDTMEIRVISAIDLFNMPAPVGNFDVTGVISQFDATTPRNSGYQLLPRRAADLFVIPPPPSDPNASLDSTTYKVQEGTTVKTITVKLNKPATKVTSVNFDVAGGSATPGADYTIGTPNPITFQIGDSVKTVQINIVNDLSLESTETIDVELSNAVNCTLVNPITATVTILDNDFIGLNTSKAGVVSVYPNPTSAEVKVVANENINKVQILNMVGQVIIVKENINNKVSYIDLSNLESGVYTILVETNTGILTNKIMKN